MPRRIVPDSPEFAPERRLLEFFRVRPGATFLQAIDELAVTEVRRHYRALERLLARGGLRQLSDAKPFRYVAIVGAKNESAPGGGSQPVDCEHGTRQEVRTDASSEPPIPAVPVADSPVPASPPQAAMPLELRRAPAGEFVTRCRPTGTPFERA